MRSWGEGIGVVVALRYLTLTIAEGRGYNCLHSGDGTKPHLTVTCHAPSMANYPRRLFLHILPYLIFTTSPTSITSTSNNVGSNGHLIHLSYVQYSKSRNLFTDQERFSRRITPILSELSYTPSIPGPSVHEDSVLLKVSASTFSLDTIIL